MNGGVNRGYPAKMMFHDAERSRRNDPAGGGSSGGVVPLSDGTWRKDPWWAGVQATPACGSYALGKKKRSRYRPVLSNLLWSSNEILNLMQKDLCGRKRFLVIRILSVHPFSSIFTAVFLFLKVIFFQLSLLRVIHSVFFLDSVLLEKLKEMKIHVKIFLLPEKIY